jgi:hypothetical protein
VAEPIKRLPEGAVKSSEPGELLAPLRAQSPQPQATYATLQARSRLGGEGLTCKVEIGHARCSSPMNISLN